jgi:hypothetical protein
MPNNNFSKKDSYKWWVTLKTSIKNRWSKIRSGIKQWFSKKPEQIPTIKKTRKEWVGWILVFFISALVLTVLYFSFISKENNSIKEFIILCKSNAILALLGLAIFLIGVVWFIHWKWINEVTWFGRKQSFLLLFIIAIVLFIFRDEKNLTALEELRIHFKYRAERDSLVKIQKEEYASLKAGLKYEAKKVKKELSSLKESLDSSMTALAEVKEQVVEYDKLANNLKEESAQPIVPSEPKDDEPVVQTTPIPKEESVVSEPAVPAVTSKTKSSKKSSGQKIQYVRYTGPNKRNCNCN